MIPKVKPIKVHLSIPRTKVDQITSAINTGEAVTRAEFIREAINAKLEKLDQSNSINLALK